MISKPTVLILGAGASSHVKYPLGSDLIKNLCNNHGSLKAKYSKYWKPEDIDRFITRLSHSGYYSIDAFLETVPDLVEIGKFLLAQEIKRHENINLLFPPHDSGWYQYLFNSLLDGNDTKGFSSSKLSIITFNYDRSLEAYLHTALMARFGMHETEASDTLSNIPIIHVHGILGKYPEVPYTSECDFNQLLEISKQIKIIHEVEDQEDGFCNDEFKQAHSLLKDAERIMFLGFGFHKDNIRRFNFFSNESINVRQVYATLKGMGDIGRQKLRTDLKEFGISGGIIKPQSGLYNCNNFFAEVTSLD